MMSKILVEPERPQMTICWISKATRTHAHAHAPGQPPHARARTHINTEKYLILTAFAWQELFRECASMLRYMYLACLVSTLTEPHWLPLTKTLVESLNVCWRRVLNPDDQITLRRQKFGSEWKFRKRKFVRMDPPFCTDLVNLWLASCFCGSLSCRHTTHGAHNGLFDSPHSKILVSEV